MADDRHLRRRFGGVLRVAVHTLRERSSRDSRPLVCSSLTLAFPVLTTTSIRVLIPATNACRVVQEEQNLDFSLPRNRRSSIYGDLFALSFAILGVFRGRLRVDRKLSGPVDRSHPVCKRSIPADQGAINPGASRLGSDMAVLRDTCTPLRWTMVRIILGSLLPVVSLSSFLGVCCRCGSRQRPEFLYRGVVRRGSASRSVSERDKGLWPRQCLACL